jgi:subtilase family serine protease
MQTILKLFDRHCQQDGVTATIRRHRWRTRMFGGLTSTTLLLGSGALFAAVTTVELSPLVTKSTLVAPLDKGKQISVLLALPSSDPAGLADFVQHVSTPGDLLYHQYLTPQQFAERFGGDEADYSALKSWATAKGLVVSNESSGRTNLTVRGSVSQFETIFKTQLNSYRTANGDNFYSASVPPSVPDEIAPRISALIGLTESKQLTPFARVAKTLGENPNDATGVMRGDTAGGTGPGGTYSAEDLRTVYSVPSFGSFNKGTVMAVFEQGYYNPSDTAKYFAHNKLPRVEQTPIAVNHSPIVKETEVEVEACLDIDMIAGINPNVSEILVYIDDYNYDSFQVAMVDALTQVASDDKAQILSISYGQDEGLQGTSVMTAEQTALQQCAAEGITVFASSGDNGAFGDYYHYPYNVADPASQPLITGVGGTTLYTGPGEVWENEVAWDELKSNHGATGGGVSTYWPLPPYQNQTVGGTFYVTENGGSSKYRNVPDVAAVGDPLTGVGVYVKDQGGWLQVGGTSVSSPIWAGYLSLINAAFSHFKLGNVGFFNPMLYAIGTPYYGSGDPAGWLYDVSQGQNGLVGSNNPGYFNGFGYSNTTGNGSIWGGGLAAQLLIGQSQPGTPPGAIYGFAVKVKGTTAEFTWLPSSGAVGYVVAIYHSGDYGYYDTNSFVTDQPTLTVKDLPPIPSNPSGEYYWAYVWSFNASGGYYDKDDVTFNTR